MRPTDFTDEMRVAADDEIAHFREQQRKDPASVKYSIPDQLFELAHFREIWYVGVWLEQKLLAAGCSAAKAKDICFANGQKCAMAADPWIPTQRTAADFAAGKPMDEPGPELAPAVERSERPVIPTM